MTYKDIDTMLWTLDIPYAYHQFPIPENPDEQGQQPPFICWYLDGIDDLYADDTNYQRIVRLIVEYYSDEKDFTNEETIENVLSAHGLTYAKDETYIDDEQMHETIYEMEVLING